MSRYSENPVPPDPEADLFFKGVFFLIMALLVSLFFDFPGQLYVLWGIYVGGSYWLWFFIIANEDEDGVLTIISLIGLTVYWYYEIFT